MARSAVEAKWVRASRRAEAQILGERTSDPSSDGSNAKTKRGGRVAGRWLSDETAAEHVMVSIERVVRVDGSDAVELGDWKEAGELAKADGGGGGGEGASMSEGSLAV